MKQINIYWEVLDELPQGWVIDEKNDTPIPNTIFITNGKSLLSGKQKRALLKIKPQILEVEKSQEPKRISLPKEKKEEEKQAPQPYPSKEANKLARAKMIRKLLADIMVDLQICELEGWDKKEYLQELQDIINSFNIN